MEEKKPLDEKKLDSICADGWFFEGKDVKEAVQRALKRLPYQGIGDDPKKVFDEEFGEGLC